MSKDLAGKDPIVKGEDPIALYILTEQIFSMEKNLIEIEGQLNLIRHKLFYDVYWTPNEVKELTNQPVRGLTDIAQELIDRSQDILDRATYLRGNIYKGEFDER